MTTRARVKQFSKGYIGRTGKNRHLAKRTVQKALKNQYVDRRLRKRDMRRLFITQINAGTRQFGMAYNQFMHALVRENIKIDRKMLATLAVTEPYSFKALVEHAKSVAIRDGFYIDVNRERTATQFQAEEDTAEYKLAKELESFEGSVSADEVKRMTLERLMQAPLKAAGEVNAGMVDRGVYRIIEPEQTPPVKLRAERRKKQIKKGNIEPREGEK